MMKNVAFIFLAALLARPPLQVTKNRLTVRYHAGDDLMAARVERLCREDRTALAKRLGVRFQRPIEVVLTRGDSEFNRETEARAPKWALAIAAPGRDKIVIRTGLITPTALNALGPTLRHEMCHIGMAQVERRRRDRMPLWFHEGVAVWVSGSHGLRPRHEMEIAETQDALIPLAQINKSFPADPTAAALAYQQSESFVRYMVARFGEPVIPGIIQEYARGAQFNEAVRLVTGTPLAEIESQWRGERRPRWPWLRLLWKATSLFTGLAALCVVAYFVVRRRRRRLSEEWEREERLLGPPANGASDEKSWYT